MRADRWWSHGRLETQLIAPLTDASKRLWLDADEQVRCASQESTYEGEYPSTLCLALGKGDDVDVAAEPRFRSVAGRPMWGSCRDEPNHRLFQRNLQTDTEGSMR